MTKILIKNGTLVNASPRFLKKGDILIENGKIKEISGKIKTFGVTVLNASGRLVIPGIIDVHVHTRQPGDEESETLESAWRSALSGGVTSFLAMPNTNPPVDSPALLRKLKSKKDFLNANVFFAAATTAKRRGKKISGMKSLKKAGAKAFTDDGSPVENPAVFEKALKTASSLGTPVLEHCEEKNLSQNGVLNFSVARKLGLTPIFKESEIFMVARNILISGKNSLPVHLQHISCAESVRLIKMAKEIGFPVTCETCPHYFSLTERDAMSLNPNFKMNPPLRAEKDKREIIQGIKDGTIDIIASDHAPHSPGKKAAGFLKAPFGVIGMETMLPLVVTYLLSKKVIDEIKMVELLSLNPAVLLNLPKKGRLSIGMDADICILEPAKERKVAPPFKSRSLNSPFIGKKLRGWPAAVICGGKIVFAKNI